MTNIAIGSRYGSNLKCLAEIFDSIPDTKIAFIAENGKDLFNKLSQRESLKLNYCIIDVDMPIIDGVAITNILKDCFPDLPIIGFANTAFELLGMIDAGAKGFLLNKSITREILIEAQKCLLSKKKYIDVLFFPVYKNHLFVRKISNDEKIKLNHKGITNFSFNKNEIFFLKLIVNGIEYEEIAKIMNKSIRTIHNYHDAIKDKTGFSTKLEQAIFSIKNNIGNLSMKIKSDFL